MNHPQKIPDTLADLTLHCDKCGVECYPPDDAAMADAERDMDPVVARNTGFTHGLYCTDCFPRYK